MSSSPRKRKQKNKPGRISFAPIMAEANAATRRGSSFKSKQVIFAQGDVADSVFYIRKGRVKLSVVSGEGKEAVVAIQRDDEFLGEGCLIGQAVRRTTATALTDCEIARIEKDELLRMIQEVPTFARIFIAHILERNARIEDDLVDYHFNSTEKRLARALLLLANLESKSQPQEVVEKVSQEMLAEMIGATRSRVSHFMNKFRQRGFIDYNGHHLEVRNSLLQVVLSESSGSKPACVDRRMSPRRSSDLQMQGGVPRPRDPAG
jgi:CRP/FNR family cyclic AMP-dependent transcriptional regulator